MIEHLFPHLPISSHSYCQELLDEKPIRCYLAQARTSKWGDFRFKGPIITVNKNLPPPLFLLTFLHELAHFHTYIAFGRKISPHGIEWKTTFQELVKPMTEIGAFGALNDVVTAHMKRPKATIGADAALHSAALKAMGMDGQQVAELNPGDTFTFRNERYRVETTLRKRIRCVQISSGKRFLFQPSVQIDMV
ncbi:MAG: hypothetical protein P8H59_04905 [Flavobacteriales bacterium]|nr:hypothetical protein [Flavobacteriales bacterium]MDG1780270.1 hypothetical protein [Flavobacteriales bacterium]MDG2244785.1 hypothetical protein [Flavobacteriales bacterium]